MTLMEVMIAMFIFVVSVLGYSKLQSGLFHQGMDNRQRSIAIWKAEELMEIISANSSPSSLAEYVDAVSDPDVCLIEPAKNCIEVANSIPKLHRLARQRSLRAMTSGTRCVPRMMDRRSSYLSFPPNLNAIMSVGMTRA